MKRRNITNLGLVHMVVISFIGATNYHDNIIFASVKAEIVHRGLQQMAIIREPFGKIEWRSKRHFS